MFQHSNKMLIQRIIGKSPGLAVNEQEQGPAVVNDEGYPGKIEKNKFYLFNLKFYAIIWAAAVF